MPTRADNIHTSIKLVEKLKKCPHCNSDSGFYLRYHAEGTVLINYSFSGRQLSTNAIQPRLFLKDNTVYCCSCHRRIKNIKPELLAIRSNISPKF